MLDRVYCFYVLRLSDPLWHIERYHADSPEYPISADELARVKATMSERHWLSQVEALFWAEAEGPTRIHYTDNTETRTLTLDFAKRLIHHSGKHVQRVTDNDKEVYERGVTTREYAIANSDAFGLWLVDMEQAVQS